MNWRVKGAIQRYLCAIPKGEHVNDVLQQTVGGLRNMPANIAGKTKDFLNTAAYLQGVDVRPEGFTLVEIGSGWYPTLPVCFFLSGTRRVYTYDIVRHMNWKLTRRMVECLKAHLPEIAKASGRPLEAVTRDHNQLLACTSLPQLLETARIEYRAPADACETGLPNDSVDLVYSNSVLEHVPKPVIAAMARESRRILRNDGLMLHNVACNDHYAHVDRSISFINFLQFPEQEWQKWNPSIHYQNRLRASEFLALAEESGFKLLTVKKVVRPGTREALEKMKVAPEFQQYEPEDLITTTVDFIARKAAPNSK